MVSNMCVRHLEIIRDIYSCNNSSLHKTHVYFFSNEQTKQKCLANPLVDKRELFCNRKVSCNKKLRIYFLCHLF